MIELWSMFEQAWRSTLVHAAEGDDFRDLCLTYGLPWPEFDVSEEAWRGALHAEAYGIRPSLATTYWMLEAALSDYNEIYTLVATADPYQYEVYVVGGGKLSGLDGDWAARLWRTQYGLLWSDRVITDRVIFSPYSTTYWDACSSQSEGTMLEAQLLPFTLRERTPGEIDATGETTPGEGCRIEVEFHSYNLARKVSTYMHADATKRRITGVDTGTNTITLNAAHGCSVNDVVMVFSSYGSAYGGTDAPPGGLTDYTKYYVKTAPTPTSLTLSATLGGATVDLVSAGTGLVYIARVTDFVNTGDLYGHMLPDQSISSNVEATHPYASPAFLHDGLLFPRVIEALEGCVAAGVKVVEGWSPILPHAGWGVRDWRLLDPSPGL